MNNFPEPSKEIIEEKSSVFYPLKKLYFKWECWSVTAMLEPWEKFFVSKFGFS